MRLGRGVPPRNAPHLVGMAGTDAAMIRPPEAPLSRSTLPPAAGAGTQGATGPVAERGEADPLLAHALRDPLKDGPPVQRTVVETNGGTFRDLHYRPTDNGLDILLSFEPNDVVAGRAKKIGLVQSVRRLVGGEKEQERGEKHAEPGDADVLPVVDATGAHIDQRPDTHNSPVYEAADRRTSASLADTEANPLPAGQLETGQLWEHTSPRRPAWLADTPGVRPATIAAGIPVRDTLETAAIVLDPAPNVYLGSVAWGWEAKGGVVTAAPPQIRLASAGAPTREFMAAATAWNANDTFATLVDLPTVSAEHRRTAVASLDKKEVGARIVQAEAERKKVEATAEAAKRTVTELEAQLVGIRGAIARLAQALEQEEGDEEEDDQGDEEEEAGDGSDDEASASTGGGDTKAEARAPEEGTTSATASGPSAAELLLADLGLEDAPAPETTTVATSSAPPPTASATVAPPESKRDQRRALEAELQQRLVDRGAVAGRLTVARQPLQELHQLVLELELLHARDESLGKH